MPVPAPLRVALWNPAQGSRDPSLNLDPERLARVQGWLQAAGAPVTSLRADQLADAAQLSPGRFDVLVTPGAPLPLAAWENVRAFARGGGWLLALQNENAPPWSIALVPDVNGLWRALPSSSPRASLAQSELGLRFSDYSDQNGTYSHRAAPLLSRFWPRDKTSPAPKPLPEFFAPSPRLQAEEGAQITPLVRSFRVANGVPSEGTPQIFVVQRGAARALIIGSALWSSDDAETWTQGEALFSALLGVCRALSRQP